jgi:hypothetical protein
MYRQFVSLLVQIPLIRETSKLFARRLETFAKVQYSLEYFTSFAGELENFSSTFEKAENKLLLTVGISDVAAILDREEIKIPNEICTRIKQIRIDADKLHIKVSSSQNSDDFTKEWQSCSDTVIDIIGALQQLSSRCRNISGALRKLLPGIPFKCGRFSPNENSGPVVAFKMDIKGYTKIRFRAGSRTPDEQGVRLIDSFWSASELIGYPAGLQWINRAGDGQTGVFVEEAPEYCNNTMRDLPCLTRSVVWALNHTNHFNILNATRKDALDPELNIRIALVYSPSEKYQQFGGEKDSRVLIEVARLEAFMKKQKLAPAVCVTGDTYALLEKMAPNLSAFFSLYKKDVFSYEDGKTHKVYLCKPSSGSPS